MDQTTLSLDSYNKMKRNVLSLALEAPVALNSMMGGMPCDGVQVMATFMY